MTASAVDRRKLLSRGVVLALALGLWFSPVPEGLTEVNQSLVLYGLPDLTTASVKSPDDRMRLRDAVAETVRIFEPRLEGVEVSLESEAETERAVRFRIDARLKVDPVPEPVTFDTTLQLASGEFQVKGDG